MKNWMILLSLMLMTTSVAAQSGFMAEQKRFPRVRTAFNEKEDAANALLAKNGISTDKLNVLLVACKAEKKLWLYAKNSTDKEYRQIAEYKICASSGTLGPKRRQGDGQVPEGFYHIDRFNPSSNYYLSLGINYPNRSDRIKCAAASPGGDIFIHGSCVTIGCLPMTDDKIKELYVYAVLARHAGQMKIPVYIFPFVMTAGAMGKYEEAYKETPELVAFWKNLKQGYDKFAADRRELKISVNDNGDYKVGN